MRSPFLMDASAEDGNRLSGGFLRTGDLGYLDADGFLWVEGRVSEQAPSP